MQYIYFGLIPFLVAAWLVWRQHYAPMGETSWAHTLTYILVVVAYSWHFNITAGLLTAIGVGLIYLILSRAVKSDQLERRSSYSSHSDRATDTYKEYEQYIKDELRLKDSSKHKKTKASKYPSPFL